MHLRVESTLEGGRTPSPVPAGEGLPAGHRIGPYRVLQEIGQGGMGTVYEAVRDDDQYSSRVAVKLIHPGRDEESVVRRFRMERQILARLEHPNIARLYDGGTTAEGRPYFVMELVEGVPINRYCDERRLAVRRRLELFRQVCGAVQLAHQNLVVHRDIKPSNILVTDDGVPKLLDFGIAKLLEGDPADPTAQTTRSVFLPMTPQFASPEQIYGALTTTASDIYSLGVVLYFLLTGRLPYHFWGSSPLAEMVSRMQHEETTAPSAAVLQDAEGAETEKRTALVEVSRQRNAQPRELSRQLAGDLDNIVLMALAKDPRRRYGSVEQLSEDLRRHLLGFPVMARPATLGYRMGKYVRRHRLVVAAVATILGLLIAFSVAMTFQVAETARQRDLAELERDKAEEVADFLVEIFEVVDPGEARGNTITAREILDQGARRVAQQLSDQPLVEATLLNAIGTVYRKLGLFDQALPLLEEALGKRRDLLGAEHLDVATSLVELGTLHLLRGEYDRTEPLYREALLIRQRLLPADHPELGTSFARVGDVYTSLGDYDKSESFFLQALEILDDASDDYRPQLATVLDDFSGVFRMRGDLERARSMLERSLAIRQTLAPDHPDLATTLHNLASVYLGRGQAERAEPLFLRAQEIYEKTLGDDHVFRAAPLMKLAGIYQNVGDYERSEQATRQVQEIFEKAYSPDHVNLGIVQHNLGILYIQQGELERAQPYLERAVEIYTPQLGEDHPFVATSLHYLGRIERHRGDPKQAEAALQRALEIRQQSLDGNHHHVALTLEALGELAAAERRHDEARGYYERSLAIREQRAADNPGNAQEQCRLASSLLGLGRLHSATGDAERSRALLERAVALSEPLAQGSRNVEILATHALALLYLGRTGEASHVAQELVELGFAEPDFATAFREAGLIGDP